MREHSYYRRICTRHLSITNSIPRVSTTLMIAPRAQSVVLHTRKSAPSSPTHDMIVSGAQAYTPVAGRIPVHHPRSTQPVMRKAQIRLDTTSAAPRPATEGGTLLPTQPSDGEPRMSAHVQSPSRSGAIRQRPAGQRLSNQLRPASQAGLVAAVPRVLNPFSEERLRELIPSPPKPESRAALGPVAAPSKQPLGWGSGCRVNLLATQSQSSSSLHASASGPLPSAAHKQHLTPGAGRNLMLLLTRPTPNSAEPGTAGSPPRAVRARSAAARTPSAAQAPADFSNLQINLSASSTPPVRPRGSGILGGKPVLPPHRPDEHAFDTDEELAASRSPLRPEPPKRRVSFVRDVRDGNVPPPSPDLRGR